MDSQFTTKPRAYNRAKRVFSEWFYKPGEKIKTRYQYNTQI